MKVTLQNSFGSCLVGLLDPVSYKMVKQVPNGSEGHTMAKTTMEMYVAVYVGGTQYMVNAAHVKELWNEAV